MSNQPIRIFVESTDGERFECEIPADTRLETLAADFFDERQWPTRDRSGRAQRAVVELVDPESPNRTKRLRGDQTLESAGLWEGAILRIFPESIAGLLGGGVVDERHRMTVLTADLRSMQDLAQWNRQVHFTGKPEGLPFEYTVTLHYRSFATLDHASQTPTYSNEHQVHITLHNRYPQQAPWVRWLTPIFHPNIASERGAVCLGVLTDHYLPGMGLARLVTMLCEMVQWRNYDFDSALNREAADWAKNSNHWDAILAIGGSPFQGPIFDLVEQLHKQQRTPIRFQRVA